jgi:hypothetical protein
MNKYFKNFKWMAVLATALTIGFASCDKEDNGTEDIEGSTGTFSVKCASVHYQHIDGTSSRFTFDDYRQRARIDAWGDDGEHGIVIIDAVDRHYYIYAQNNEAEHWEAPTYSESYIPGIVASYQYDLNAQAISMLPGARQSTETIAGKSCTVVTFTAGSETVSYAGWSNILFKITTGSEGMTADSFSATVPANAFAQTVNIFN